jgi:predicted kinase
MLPLKYHLIALGTLAVIFGCGLWLGFAYTSEHYEKMIQAKEIAVLEAQQQERKEHDAKLIEATNLLRDELNRTTDLARSRGADIERLRNANAQLQARIKASPASADREALARCSSLLTEGAGLVAEGERLLLKHGAEHDSLIRIEKWQ